MSQSRRSHLFVSAAVRVTLFAFAGSKTWSQKGNQAPAPPTQSQQSNSGHETPGELYGKLLQVPVSSLIPGNVAVSPGIQPPKGDEPQAVSRGMRYFNAFNCVGCHAANGGGVMGP